MNSGNIKKAYLAAAAAAGGIIAAIVFYTVVVEILRAKSYAAPVQPPAAYALKYAFYLLGASALLVLKFAGRPFEEKKAAPEEAVKALTRLAVLRAAVCELPAIAGLVLFLLTRYYLDFYMLALFSLALEIYHFPRLQAWEEKLRGDFGQL